MEQLYKDPRTPLRMREGPLGAYVDAFAQQLIDEGYAKASARYALQLVADLARWLASVQNHSAATHRRTPRALSGIPIPSTTPSLR